MLVEKGDDRMNYWDMIIGLMDIAIMLFVIGFTVGLIFFGLVAAYNLWFIGIDNLPQRHPIIIYQETTWRNNDE